MMIALKSLVSVAGLLVVLDLWAVENLIRNGRFVCDQVEIPAGWKIPAELKIGKEIKFLLSSGPEGRPSVLFSNEGTQPLSGDIRQFDLTLVAGETYRLRAFVRTRGFSYKGESGLLVINSGWTQTEGICDLPSDSDWHEVDRTFKMVSSPQAYAYSVAVRLSGFTGELEVADMRLEAVSQAAIEGSKPSLGGFDVAYPRLIPWSPRLARIPSDRREIQFRFFGAVPKETAYEDYNIVLRTDDAELESRVPLHPGINAVPLPPNALEGRMNVRIVSCSGGIALTDDDYRFSVVPPAPQPTTGRRLNSFVAELVNERIGDVPFRKSIAMHTDGWLYLAVRGASHPVICLDDVEIVSPALGMAEAFRAVSAGTHEVSVKDGSGAMLIVRTVPEIFNYPICQNSYVDGNLPYDWAFTEKYVLPCCNAPNGGAVTVEQRKVLQDRGYRWTANIRTSEITSGADLVRRIRSSPLFHDPTCAGFTLDEHFFAHPKKLQYLLDGLKAYNADDQGVKLAYTYLVGTPANYGLDHEVASAAVNAARGRGRMMSEVYCRSRPSEDEARREFHGYVKDTMVALSTLCDDGKRHVGLVLGNFNQLPILSLWHHPEVDFKVFLDLMLNEMANDPEFEDLGCVGYWGSYYADEEIHRWSMAVLRHYCIEGQKDMLSSRYGYCYLPGHVVNGDFRSGLEGWKTTGAVCREVIQGFGEYSEARWGGANGLGDAFAVLKREAETPAELRQTLRGLVPGRRYSLQALLFDAQDARAKRYAPKDIPVQVMLNGATVSGRGSWRYVEKGRTYRTVEWHRKHGAIASVCHILFTASREEVELTLSNAEASHGSEQGVNGISVLPYYEETDLRSFDVN